VGGDWADGEGGDVARGWRRLPAWARWGLIALVAVGAVVGVAAVVAVAWASVGVAVASWLTRPTFERLAWGAEGGG
jgi:hypothetical protein